MKKTKRIEPYIYIVAAFLVDIFILVYGTLRHLSLPTRYKKGNLLSTLFHLFTDLTEGLIGLKRELTRTPWTYGKKYVRLGMLALTWALFILSSFEWTGLATRTDPPVPGQQTSTDSNTIRTGRNAPSYAIVKSTAFAVTTTTLTPSDSPIRPILNISLANTTPACSPAKRWLVFRKLLI